MRAETSFRYIPPSKEGGDETTMEKQIEQPYKKEQFEKPTKAEEPVKVPRFTDGTSAFVQGHCQDYKSRLYVNF